MTIPMPPILANSPATVKKLVDEPFGPTAESMRGREQGYALDSRPEGIRTLKEALTQATGYPVRFESNLAVTVLRKEVKGDCEQARHE